MLTVVLVPVAALWARQVPDSAEVSCQVPNEPEARMYVLSRLPAGTGKPWHLSYKSRMSRDWIRLRLSGAAPAIAATSAALSYKSANGGIAVDLRTDAATSSLDVYVSYELEVNVDASLAPDVDALNTHGPLTGLSCRIVGATAAP